MIRQTQKYVSREGHLSGWMVVGKTWLKGLLIQVQKRQHPHYHFYAFCISFVYIQSREKKREKKITPGNHSTFCAGEGEKTCLYH